MRMTCILVSLSTLVGCALSGVRSAPTSVAELKKALDTSDAVALSNGPAIYNLGPADSLKVQIFGEPELSGNFVVDSNSSVSFPLIGRIEVGQLDSRLLSTLLIEKYGGYLKQPRVSVTVTEFRSKKVSIFGFVKEPGTFNYESGMTIVHAITLAGGFDKLADENGTYINRTVEGVEKKFQVPVKRIGKGEAKNVLLLPGDVIYIPESMF